MIDAGAASASAPDHRDPSAPTASAGWWRLLVLLWPICLLWPCLFGGRTFLPFDVAAYPPSSLQRTDAELQRINADKNTDITETPIWFVPELQRAGRTIRAEHSLPNWHPTARTGTALLPHGHDAMLYPPVWPALLTDDPARWLGWLALIDLSIAGYLMFGFLRALRLQPAACALGALAFCASTTLCANAHNYSRLASLTWLPGMLWGLRAAADATGIARRRPLVGFSICFALTWIGGFPPFAIPASLLGCGYGLALALTELRRDHTDGRRLGLQFLAAIGLGAALAAIYVLPAFAFFGSSARTLTPDLRHISQVGFDWYGLLGYLAPDLFGKPDLVDRLPYDRSPLVLLLADRTQYGGGRLLPNFNATEYALYAGALVIWLAVLGLGHRRTRHPWFPAAMLVLYWATAAFVLPLGYLFVLPGIQAAPPLRFLGPCCGLVAWLAAQGFDLVLRREAKWRLPLAAGLALTTAATAWLIAGRAASPQWFADLGLATHVADTYREITEKPELFTAEVVEQKFLHGPDGIDYVAAGAALLVQSARRAAGCHLGAAILLVLWSSRRRWPPRGRLLLATAAIAITAGELMLAAQTFDRGIERAFSDRTPVHDFLVAERQHAAATGGFMIARAAPIPADGAMPVLTSLPPGTLGPDGIRDLQVYTYFDARSAAPLQAMLDAVPGVQPIDLGKGYLAVCLPDHPLALQSPLLDLLGVRYLLATSSLQHAGARVLADWRPPRGEFFVYERPTPCPRAFAVDRITALPSDDEVVKALAAPTFAPRRTALALADDLQRSGVADHGADGASARNVRFARDHANAIDLEVTAGPEGWLVLTDTFAPGWSATIDDIAVPMLRVDHALRAVPLPAGACTVAFRYVPPRQRLGFLLTGLAAIAAILVLRRSRNSSTANAAAETAA